MADLRDDIQAIECHRVSIKNTLFSHCLEYNCDNWSHGQESQFYR